MRFAVLFLMTFCAPMTWAAGVTVQRFAELAIFPEMSAPATVVSPNDSRLGAEVAGVIAEIAVSVGQTVRAGEVLARLDDRDYRLAMAQAQAALEAAQARLKLAEYQLASARTLAAQGSASQDLLNARQAEHDVLRAEIAARQAALEGAQRDLERTRLRAPFDGVVAARPGQVGERAAAGAPLLRLVQRDGLEVSARLREGDVASLRASPQPEFQGQGAVYLLRLRVVTPVVEAQERTREARLAFAREAPLPGSAGRLVWRDAVAHLPAHLVQRRNGVPGVFVAREGKARFLALAGAQEGRPAAAASLSPDTPVVVDGRQRLQDGDAIEPR